MDKKLSPKAAFLKTQMEELNALGVSPDKFAGVIDDIINGDLSDKNYKKSAKPLKETAPEDKEKEANRILDNYSIALKALENNGPEQADMTVVKMSIIVGAASAGLSALGMDGHDINYALGLPQVDAE